MRVDLKKPIRRFQSTPSRGGRHFRAVHKEKVSCFNPRPHAEGDKTPLNKSLL